MANQGPGLEYQIKVTGAGQGAAEVGKLTDATKKAGEASGKAAPEAKSLSEALASLGGRNNPAKDVLEGISTAARGGEGSIFGLTKAFKGLKELGSGGLAALGPGGALVAGLGVLVGLLPKLIELFRGTGKSAEELAQESKKAADDVKELGQQRLEALSAGFSNANEAAKKANAEFERALQLQARINEANRAAELAENPDKAKEINAKYDAQKKALTLSSKEFAASQANDIANAAASNEKDAFNAEVAAKKQLIDLLQEETKLKKYLESPEAKYSAAVDSDARYKQEQMRKRVEEISAKKPEAAEEVSARTKESQLASENLAKAREAQSQANQEAEAERMAQNAENKSQRRIANVDVKKRTSDIEQQKIALGDRAQKAYEAGDYAGQNEAVAEIKSLGKAAEEAKLDLKPIEDASGASAEALDNFASNSNKSVSETASALQNAAESIPPALDLSGIQKGFDTYHQTNLSRHEESKRAISDLQRQLNALSQQLANSRNK